jgi:exopolyphosphatase / guanosine-5'-triphosphate,3'-diphosphate pyrophosphatase
MVGFKHLIDAYQPIAYQAYATSAMRGAKNGPQICDRIEQASGIRVEIIEGPLEAQLIFENKSAESFGGYNEYLYVDVGGGSTEITLFAGGRVAGSASFDIGTIRILQNQVTEAHWEQMHQWLKARTAKKGNIAAIGSGGNINKIFRLANCKTGRPLSVEKLQEVRRELVLYSFEERITILDLRPDRADVIVPAADIYLNVMRWSGAQKIFVPQVGLADGAVRILYQKHKESAPV